MEVTEVMEQKMILESHQGNPYTLVAVFHNVSRWTPLSSKKLKEGEPGDR